MSSGVVQDEDFHLIIFHWATVTWSAIKNVLDQNQFLMKLLHWFRGAPVIYPWVPYRVHTFIIGVTHTVLIHYACVISNQRIDSVHWICLFSNQFLAWFLLIARFDLVFRQKVFIIAIVDYLLELVLELIGPTGQCLFLCLILH